MDPVEMEGWRAANQAITALDRATRPCIDCPAWFAGEMREQGRCNGVPGVDGYPDRGRGTPTAREMETFEATCRLGGIAAAAEEMGVSYHTAKNTLWNLYQRIGADGAVRAAWLLWGPGRPRQTEHRYQRSIPDEPVEPVAQLRSGPCSTPSEQTASRT